MKFRHFPIVLILFLFISSVQAEPSSRFEHGFTEIYITCRPNKTIANVSTGLITSQVFGYCVSDSSEKIIFDNDSEAILKEANSICRGEDFDVNWYRITHDQNEAKVLESLNKERVSFNATIQGSYISDAWLMYSNDCK